jgi:predicted transcriptional regulator
MALKDPAPSLGDQELALLQLLAESGPLSVGEAAERFGEPRGLARTTVLTMMERLRRKGRLRRRRVDGVYRYSSPVGAPALLAEVVGDFVRGPLAGSLQPFVAYLAERVAVSAEELRELEALVERLRRERGEEYP